MQMTVLKSANKELKGMMKTVKIQDIDVRSLALFASVCFNTTEKVSLIDMSMLVFCRICKMK